MGDTPTLRDAILYFADYQRCHETLVRVRWPDRKLKCPVCGSEKVCYLAGNRIWKCAATHPKPCFSLKTGTIFQDSPIGLEKWLPAVWMLLNGKNISSSQLSRALGVTQKTGWFMLHRIRLAMQSRVFHPSGDALPPPKTDREDGPLTDTAERRRQTGPMTSEQFENTPEFRLFRPGMERLLKVSKTELDRRVREAKLSSDRIYSERPPGRKRKPRAAPLTSASPARR